MTSIYILILFAAVGVAISFAKAGGQQRTIYGLSAVVAKFVADTERRAALEVIIFLIIGCLLSLGIAQPTNPAQAFAAGVAWTSLASR
jgi:hypothetical protein